jgi:hypothetical protein
MYKITLPGGYAIHVYSEHMTDHLKLAPASANNFVED